MKIVVHDYSGHPFQVHLSRALARRGHEVHHLYCGYHAGPKGFLQCRPDDPASLCFRGVESERACKDNGSGTGKMGLGRLIRELAYGQETARVIRHLNPDIVLCGNTPADAQRAIIGMCRHEDIRFVYWLQDIYSIAVTTLLSKELGPLGKLIGQYYRWLDRKQFRASDAIVSISHDFTPLITPLAPDVPISVIENWAAIGDIPVCLKNNSWSRTHRLHDGFAYLYSGTLGRKHNWEFLAKLATRCRWNESVVAVAQGYGVPRLKAAQTEQTLRALKILPIQPAEHLAHLLGTADVLLATIEAEAGKFAVPSKVLSYLCAGRPILLAASRDNLAARTVERANAGIIVHPSDEAGFLAAAELLRKNADLRQTMGANGRRYAEQVFDVESITDRFEAELLRTVRNAAVRSTINLGLVTAK